MQLQYNSQPLFSIGSNSNLLYNYSIASYSVNSAELQTLAVTLQLSINYPRFCESLQVLFRINPKGIRLLSLYKGIGFRFRSIIIIVDLYRINFILCFFSYILTFVKVLGLLKMCYPCSFVIFWITKYYTPLCLSIDMY